MVPAIEVRPDRLGAVALLGPGEGLGHLVEGRVPGDRLEAALCPSRRLVLAAG